MLQLTYLGNNLFVYCKCSAFHILWIIVILENNKLIYILDVNVEHILISERPK